MENYTKHKVVSMDKRNSALGKGCCLNQKYIDQQDNVDDYQTLNMSNIIEL